MRSPRELRADPKDCQLPSSPRALASSLTQAQSSDLQANNLWLSGLATTLS